MLAHEIMIAQVVKAKEDETVRSVIEKFIKHRISGMPVVNDRNEIVGFISDGDIMRYIGKHADIVVGTIYYATVLKGDHEAFEERTRHLLQLGVMDIAKKKAIQVSWDANVEDVAAILGHKRIKKVPVERNGVLTGIISRGDVIRHSFQSIL
ncbi:CBS domain-containing protein [Paenibacillus humicola]|uniref:CBS domain-containing protein n=1 Tax=Paenibacillus humicola TaxID=3110540 RepID=UPI00237ACA2D|nr:CBS domain-containing protein [Paenibacillus humicola]